MIIKAGYDRNDLIMSTVLENGPIDFFCDRSVLALRMACFNVWLGSRREYEIVFVRARFLSDAFTIAERENPSSSATREASRFTFGSIFMLNADVFIVYLKYIQSNFNVKRLCFSTR